MCIYTNRKQIIVTINIMVLYTVSYCAGFVGAFNDYTKLKERVLDLWNYNQFLVQKWNKECKDQDYVYIIFYKDTEYVAFITASEKEAIDALEKFKNIGSAYDESIKYHKYILNNITSDIHSTITSFNDAYKTHGVCEFTNDNIIVDM